MIMCNTESNKTWFVNFVKPSARFSQLRKTIIRNRIVSKCFPTSYFRIECWVASYTVLPNRILVNPGSNIGTSFVHLSHFQDVNVEQTETESLSSLGIRERYHKQPTQTYRKILVEFPTAGTLLALAVSVKAFNDTLGAEDIVPFTLLSGRFSLPLHQVRTKTAATHRR